MIPSSTEIVVDFADCDPARIVFYPRYYQWFDRATERIFRERGLDWPTMWAKYELAGLPLVEATAQFKGPSRFGDTIVIDTAITEWRGKVFVVEHIVRNKGEIVVEGREVRVWALRDPNDPEGMKAGVVPLEIVNQFEDA